MIFHSSGSTHTNLALSCPHNRASPVRWTQDQAGPAFPWCLSITGCCSLGEEWRSPTYLSSEGALVNQKLMSTTSSWKDWRDALSMLQTWTSGRDRNHFFQGPTGLLKVSFSFLLVKPILLGGFLSLCKLKEWKSLNGTAWEYRGNREYISRLLLHWKYSLHWHLMEL